MIHPSFFKRAKIRSGIVLLFFSVDASPFQGQASGFESRQHII
jgi:hypothetical protein